MQPIGTQDQDPAAPRPKRRRSRGTAARRRHRLRALALGVAACFGVMLVALAATSYRQWTNEPESERIVERAGEHVAAAPQRVAAVHVDATAMVPPRPIYRLSVVPGGVHSAQEVAEVVARDPVVAAHYRGIDPRRMRVERLEKPLAAHVSYRIGDQVYWTQRKLQLAAGETVLTDGETILRARCGNRVSTVRRTPVFAGEPEEAVFDLVLEPIVLASAEPTPIVRDPPAMGPVQHLRRRLVAIPEPDLRALLGLAMAAALASYLWRRRSAA